MTDAELALYEVHARAAEMKLALIECTQAAGHPVGDRLIDEAEWHVQSMRAIRRGERIPAPAHMSGSSQ